MQVCLRLASELLDRKSLNEVDSATSTSAAPLQACGARFYHMCSPWLPAADLTQQLKMIIYKHIISNYIIINNNEYYTLVNLMQLLN